MDNHLLDQILTAPPIELFKVDQRSRVWLASAGGGQWVVKRFEFNAVRQRLAHLVGCHPGQVERRRAAQMQRDGIPVVPVAFAAMRGGRFVLITPYAGVSLQRFIAGGGLLDRPRARRIIAAGAARVCELIEKRWFFRDLQVANMVLGEDDAVQLIDVGGSRRSGSRRHAVRMLAMLARSARIEGATRADCLRGLHRVLQRLPSLGQPRALAAEAVAFDHRVVELNPRP